MHVVANMLRYQLKILLLSIVLLAETAETAENCYKVKYLSIRIKDRWKYSFDLVLHPNQTLSSVSIVREEVNVPTWGALIVQHTKGRRTSKSGTMKVLFNNTCKVCEYIKNMKRYRLFTDITKSMVAKNTGNMSFTCPLKVGTYVMQNIFVAIDLPVLRFMYSPNSLYTLHAAIYDQHKNKTLETLVTYELNATLNKYC